MSGDLRAWERQALQLVQANNPRYARLSLAQALEQPVLGKVLHACALYLRRRHERASRPSHTRPAGRQQQLPL